MHREYVKWYSGRLHREMELLVFGHAGSPVVVFPTSQGRFFEFEDRGMVGAVAHKIDRGEIQLFCVDSVDSESWYARWKHPADRVWKQQDYDNYLVHEVVPFIRGRNQAPRLTVTGASLGAYHAVNFALRHPDVARYTLAMSGAYSVPQTFLDGYYDQNAYFHSPLDNVSQISDPWFLGHLSRNYFLVVAGRDDRFIGENWDLTHKLGAKGIPNRLELWDGWCHDWPYWRQMASMFL